MSRSPDADRAWLHLADALLERGPAPCQGAHPERWFSIPTSDQAAWAIAHCSNCPASAQCRTYALTADEQHGIWGGTTPADRHQLRTHQEEST